MTNSKEATLTTQSPLAPRALAALLLRPREFFSDVSTLTKRPEAYLVAWISGMANAMDRIDKNMMKVELGGTHSRWLALASWINESWVNYWIFVLASGVLSGWTLWYLGGWWYRKRLAWSGAANLTPDRVRATYAYQNLVCSAPPIVVTLVQTLAYPTHEAAWKADEYWSSLAIVFVFWSCVTSYRAALTFSVVPWKARMWFLQLPVALYVVALGVVGTLFALLPLGAS